MSMVAKAQGRWLAKAGISRRASSKASKNPGMIFICS